LDYFLGFPYCGVTKVGIYYGWIFLIRLKTGVFRGYSGNGGPPLGAHTIYSVRGGGTIFL